jgi:hypothetical protein
VRARTGTSESQQVPASPSEPQRTQRGKCQAGSAGQFRPPVGASCALVWQEMVGCLVSDSATWNPGMEMRKERVCETTESRNETPHWSVS